MFLFEFETVILSALTCFKDAVAALIIVNGELKVMELSENCSASYQPAPVFIGEPLYAVGLNRRQCSACILFRRINVSGSPWDD